MDCPGDSWTKTADHSEQVADPTHLEINRLSSQSYDVQKVTQYALERRTEQWNCPTGTSAGVPQVEPHDGCAITYVTPTCTLVCGNWGPPLGAIKVEANGILPWVAGFCNPGEDGWCSGMIACVGIGDTGTYTLTGKCQRLGGFILVAYCWQYVV